MFNNKIPLLKVNFAEIDNIILLDANENNQLTTVAIYNKHSRRLDIHNSSPGWFKYDLKSFIENNLTELKIERPGIKPTETVRNWTMITGHVVSDKFPI
jgi:hypothetical protein